MYLLAILYTRPYCGKYLNNFNSALIKFFDKPQRKQKEGNANFTLKCALEDLYEIGSSGRQGLQCRNENIFSFPWKFSLCPSAQKYWFMAFSNLGTVVCNLLQMINKRLQINRWVAFSVKYFNVDSTFYLSQHQQCYILPAKYD